MSKRYHERKVDVSSMRLYSQPWSVTFRHIVIDTFRHGYPSHYGEFDPNKLPNDIVSCIARFYCNDITKGRPFYDFILAVLCAIKLDYDRRKARSQ